MRHDSDNLIESTEPIAGSPAAPLQGENLLDLVTLLASRKRILARFTLVGALIAVVVSFIWPVRYTGTTMILPPQQSSSLSGMMVGQLGMLAGLGRELGVKTTVDLYAAMLASESVQNALVQQFQLLNVYNEEKKVDARKILQKRTAIEPLPRQGLIRVSVRDSDPKRAADIANGYVEQLHALNERIALTENSQRRMFFESQLRTAKDNLSVAEQKMKETQEHTGLLQLDAQARTIIQTVANLKAQIAAKEVQLQAMRSYATGQNPDYVLVEQQLAGLRQQLAKTLRSQNISEGDLEIPTSKVPEAGLAYLRAYRDLRYYEAIFEIIARQYEAAKLDEAKSANFAQVVDPATIPEKRSSPKRLLLVLCGLVLAFGLGCVYIVCENSYRRVAIDPLISARIASLKRHLRSRDGK